MTTIRLLDFYQSNVKHATDTHSYQLVLFDISDKSNNQSKNTFSHINSNMLMHLNRKGLN